MTLGQNVLHGFYHAAISGVAMAIPVVLMQGYSWESLTLGGILAILGNWAKLQMA